MNLPPFPVDDQTLDILAQPWGLLHAIDMYSRLAGSDPDAVESVDYIAGQEVTVLRDPQYSTQDVIDALSAEIRRLRQEAT